MSNVEKLKKKAAEFEQKKQFDKALEVYLQIIGHAEAQANEEKDVTVYNRVGDLYLRLNKTDQAVNYYEQAVDLYTEGGYLNNAIALCNKILRHAPARHQIYYKLGKISAKKGFNSDAKKNFLEYADRMHRAGKDTDAFKALQEFADLCPGQDDIRLMLAEQLAKAGKTAEAIEQLQILHESLDAEGRHAEAEATVQRIHSLDPAVEPRRSKTPVSRDSGGLVFLDTGGSSPPKPRPGVKQAAPAPRPAPPPRPKTPQHVQPDPVFEALPELEATPDEIPQLEIQSNTFAGAEPAPAEPEIEPTFDLSISDVDVSPLEGLESNADPSQFAIDPEVGGSNGVEGLISADSGLSLSEQNALNPGEPGLGEPLSTEDPLAGLSILEDDRFTVHEQASAELAPEPAAAEAAPAVEEHMPHIEALDLDIHEPGLPDEVLIRDEPPAPAVAEEPEPEPVRAPTPVRPAEKPPIRTPLREPQRVAHHPPPAPVEEEEPEFEEIEEEEVEEERPAAKAKPKAAAASPLRITRPSKKPKTPPREEQPPAAAAGQRQGINPFMRPKAKPKAPSPKGGQRVSTPQSEVPRAATPKENTAAPRTDDHYVDLGDWLREERGPRSYRMIAEEDHNRQEGEEADFTDMLEKFKAGVAANVDDEDFDSHYDLGIAYKEMGLIDEAIAEFQKALRGATHRIRAYEALGQCFIDRNDYDTAITVLGRALREPGMEDEDLIGVLYLLGYSSEGSKKPRDAAAYYQRVFAIDIDFRDVSKRLKQMTKAAAK
ncbi:MAG TPA: tetratricopeptide repeat protein [Gemmatimonadaceae bacterium]|nr:tetratricopeptide repeat protein [Gemmatimonadaceae bacterium]